MSKPAPEQRMHPRYLPPAHSYAAQGPTCSNLGTIRNISQGGLSLEYMLIDPLNESWEMIDIVNPQEGFYLHDIPCHLVWEQPSNQSSASIAGARSLLCGLRLNGMTPEQSQQLREFLNEKALGQA